MRKRLPAAALTAMLVGSYPVVAAAQAGEEPRLELRAATSSMTIERFKGEPIVLDMGIYLAALDAPFELRVTRPDYTQPIALTQRLHVPGGGFVDRALPADLLAGWQGLDDFLSLTVKDKNGEIVHESVQDLCPNGVGRERVNDSGPTNPVYPYGCYANPFTKGSIWGIDEGWGASLSSHDPNSAVKLRKGRYTVTTSIAERYVELFDVDPAKAEVTLDLRVKVIDYDSCPRCITPGSASHGRARTAASTPTMNDPDPDVLADLVALPAWGISVQNKRSGRSFLGFGATIWTTGADSMVVEGFRREDQDTMDAYQYFHRDGKVIGRAPVGEMEFDRRDGHFHWHFLQFAGYSLLTGDGEHVVKSRKEAFCLAPTDAVDLTIENAVINPGVIGLGSACGGESSLWVREVLPLGWGDTYFQGIPGQSFNITDLPNGKYLIEVEANPTGALFEQTHSNNVELREVILKGKPGERRVVVPPWNGIDTEQQGHGHHR